VTDAQDIRDIRPPFHIPQIGLWLAAIAGLCVVAALVMVAWRRRQRRLAALRKSAQELALERLAATRALLAPEHAGEFSIAVSGIIRSYIEEHFHIQAAHRTTLEFLRDCLTQSDGSLAQHRQQLEEFLQYSDLAKFARWVLSVPEMEAMLASGIAFISATATVTAAKPSDPLAAPPEAAPL
jgi:HAMP domain-containing protein